jgi:hypothetical protein
MSDRRLSESKHPGYSDAFVPAVDTLLVDVSTATFSGSLFAGQSLLESLDVCAELADGQLADGRALDRWVLSAPTTSEVCDEVVASEAR